MATEEKKRFNIIDWAIVLLIVLAAAGLVLRYGLAEKWKNSQNTVRAEIRFSISNIRETSYTGGYFAPGTRVYNSDADNNYIGVFAGEERFSYMPAKYYQISSSGEIVEERSVLDRIDVTGVILTEGVKNDNGFFYGGSTYVAPGQYISINTGGLRVQILVEEVTVLG